MHLQRHRQVGSLAGAAHLLNDNTGVLRGAQRGQKPRVEEKAKCSFHWHSQYQFQLRKQGLSILFCNTKLRSNRGRVSKEVSEELPKG